MNDAGVSDTILPTIKILSLTYIPSMFAFPLTLFDCFCFYSDEFAVKVSKPPSRWNENHFVSPQISSIKFWLNIFHGCHTAQGATYC